MPPVLAVRAGVQLIQGLPGPERDAGPDRKRVDSRDFAVVHRLARGARGLDERSVRPVLPEHAWVATVSLEDKREHGVVDVAILYARECCLTLGAQSALRSQPPLRRIDDVRVTKVALKAPDLARRARRAVDEVSASEVVGYAQVSAAPWREIRDGYTQINEPR